MVQQMLVEAYNANLADLAAHRKALDAGVEAILEKEVLEGGLGGAHTRGRWKGGSGHTQGGRLGA